MRLRVWSGNAQYCTESKLEARNLPPPRIPTGLPPVRRSLAIWLRISHRAGTPSPTRVIDLPLWFCRDRCMDPYITLGLATVATVATMMVAAAVIGSAAVTYAIGRATLTVTVTKTPPATSQWPARYVARFVGLS